MRNGVYRDGTEGAAAKRQELLQRRRAELVTMPHAVRRVVVARAARSAAGKALALGGVALAVVAASPSLAARLAGVMPGMAPAPLATLLTATWVIGVVAWAMSSARSQHRFAVAMSHYVLPTDDLDHDVERLDHERPDERARAMAHRLEVGSVAWSVLGSSTILPATILWLALLVNARAYVSVSQLEDAIARYAWVLGVFVGAGAVGAIVMTRRAARQPLTASVLVAIGVLACGVAGYAMATRMDGAWICASVAANVLVAGLVVRRLRRERALIDVADPAAGSELFTIRGAIRELRASLARIGTGLASMRARLGRTKRVTRTVIVAVVAVAVAGGVSYRRFTQRDDVRMAVTSPTAGVIAVPSGPAHQPSSPEQPLPARMNAHVESHNGSLWYDVPLDARGTASIPLMGFKILPQGWQANLVVELLGPGDSGDLRASMAGESIELGPQHRVSKLFVDACAGALPMSIELVAPAMAGKQATLRISPMLQPGACPPAGQ